MSSVKNKIVKKNCHVLVDKLSFYAQYMCTRNHICILIVQYIS